MATSSGLAPLSSSRSSQLPPHLSFLRQDLRLRFARMRRMRAGSLTPHSSLLTPRSSLLAPTFSLLPNPSCAGAWKR